MTLTHEDPSTQSKSYNGKHLRGIWLQQMAKLLVKVIIIPMLN